MKTKYVFIDNPKDKNPIFELSSEDFSRITEANKTVFFVYRFEELFAMLMNCVFTFNNVFFRYADKARFSGYEENESYFEILEINQAAVSFFSTLQMYYDYVKTSFKTIPEIMERLEDNPAILRCRTLRNYIQHVECLPIQAISSNNLCNENIILISVRFTIPKEKMKIDCLHGKTQKDFRKAFENVDEIDLYQIVSEGVDSIQNVQKKIRETSICKEQYIDDSDFLTSIYAKWKKNGNIPCYYKVTDGQQTEPSVSPYIAMTNIQMVAYFQKRYTCRIDNADKYITNAPEDFVKRCRETFLTNEVVQAIIEKRRKK